MYYIIDRWNYPSKIYPNKKKKKKETEIGEIFFNHL